MRAYPGQPSEQSVANIRLDKIKDIMLDIIEKELPDCEQNEWFIKSVHFANMIDKVMQEIWLKA